MSEKARPTVELVNSILTDSRYRAAHVVIALGTGGWVPAAYLARRQYDLHKVRPLLVPVCYSGPQGTGANAANVNYNDWHPLSLLMPAIVELSRTEGHLNVAIIDDISDSGATIDGARQHVTTLLRLRELHNVEVSAYSLYATEKGASHVDLYAALAHEYVDFDWE